MQSIDNTPQKIEQRGTLAAATPACREQATLAILAMFETLATYGRKWSPAMAQGWIMALELAPDVSLGELRRACAWWISKETDFPAPARVIAWIQVNREVHVAQERLQAEIARQDAEREQCLDEKTKRIFGKAEPTKEEIKARYRPVQVRRIKPSATFEIDQNKLREIEEQLASRAANSATKL